MASSSSRKSNSSASNQKPTFRRSTGAKRAVSSAPRASAAPSARTAAPAASRMRTYTAPTKKAASLRASSAKSAKASSRTVKHATALPATRATSRPRVTPTTRKVSSAPARTATAPRAAQARPAATKPAHSLPKLPFAEKGKKAAASTARPRFTLPGRAERGAKSATAAARPHAAPRARATGSLKERLGAFGIVRLVVVAVLAVAALVGLSAVVVVNSNLFAVTDVVVKGSDHIPQQTAAQLVDVPEGATLLNVDEDEVAARLLQNPWIESVSIEREFPHTITITPVERDVAAIAYIVADDVAWAIGVDDAWIAPLSVAAQQDSASGGKGTSDEGSSDGAALEEEAGEAGDGTDEEGDGEEDGDAQAAAARSGLEAAYQVALDNDAVLLTDVNADVSPSSGKPVDDEVIRAGLEYLHGFTPEFLAMIKDISLPSVEAISANLISGVEISLGEPEDIQQKEQVVRRLIEQEPGVTYINVRVADAYSFRSADIS